MTFKAYITAVMNKLTCFVSQGNVRTAVRRGGQFCCSFVANLLQYLFAKNYRNIMWFDKNYCKNKSVQFFAPQCGSTYHRKRGHVFLEHSVQLRNCE